jgi:hypothetical protein
MANVLEAVPTTSTTTEVKNMPGRSPELLADSPMQAVLMQRNISRTTVTLSAGLKRNTPTWGAPLAELVPTTNMYASVPDVPALNVIQRTVILLPQFCAVVEFQTCVGTIAVLVNATLWRVAAPEVMFFPAAQNDALNVMGST